MKITEVELLKEVSRNPKPLLILGVVVSIARNINIRSNEVR